MNSEQLKDLLTALCQTECVAAFPEGPVLEQMKSFCPGLHADRMGNLTAQIFPPRADGRHLMLDAHLDEIAFVVTAIDEQGFLRVGRAGGADLRALQAQEVTVLGRERLFGVFCCRPPHLSTGEDRKKVPDIEELAVDIGLSFDAAVQKVAPGDFVCLRRGPASLLNGTLTSRALDDRAGAAAVLWAADELKNEDFPAGLSVLLSLAEELGERGARTGAFAIAPTDALVVDVSFGLTPGLTPEQCGKLGGGPMIGISPCLAKSTTDLLFETAKENKIPYQTEVMPGDTGTNASAIAVTGAGVRTGMASIPLRHMHTAAEAVQLSDVENTGRLLAAFAKSWVAQKQ